MGIRDDWPELASIINTVLATFNHKDHVAIRDKWVTPIRYEYGIGRADIVKWVVGISSVALAIIIIILLWNKQLTKEISARKKAEKEIKRLRGILPLCSFCKKIRDDTGYWEGVDVYINTYSEADISHGICPECMKTHYPEMDEEI